MNILIPLDQLIPEKNPRSSSIQLAQLMSRRHICLCCSNPLLRHVYLGRLYWRCNHCYQAMPVIEDAEELPLFVGSSRFPVEATRYSV